MKTKYSSILTLRKKDMQQCERAIMQNENKIASQKTLIDEICDEMVKLTPPQSGSFVERLEEDTKTSSGIIIPDNAKEKPLMGVVKAVSAKLKADKILKEGDKVVFGKYKGAEIKLDSKEFMVLELDDILGVIEK